jgi:hypothetical protein
VGNLGMKTISNDPSPPNVTHTPLRFPPKKTPPTVVDLAKDPSSSIFLKTQDPAELSSTLRARNHA